MFTSCLKDDPANNGTVFYGHQQIPNINEFMPQELLEAIGNNRLYFGDEPPRIEGSYTTDNTNVTRVIRIPESNWMRPEGVIDGYRYFKFFEQHLGIAKIYAIIGQVLSFNKYVKVLKRRSGWILRMSIMICLLPTLWLLSILTTNM